MTILIPGCSGSGGTVRVEKHGTHLYLPVEINGVVGMFIFDTGADTTDLDKDFAEKAGIQLIPEEYQQKGMISYSSKDIRIGGRALVPAGRSYGLFHTPELKLKENSLRADKFGADGLLGFSTLSEVVFSINLKSGTFTVHSSSGAFQAPAGASVVGMEGNSPAVLLSKDGKEGHRFLLDTGAGNMLLGETLWEKWKTGVKYTRGMKKSWNGVPCTQYGVKKLKLDQISFKEFKVCVAGDAELESTGAEGLIGLNLMESFTSVVFDTASKKIIFIQR